VNDEIMRELAQIQHYAAGLQGLLATAQAQAPSSSEGADRTGTIRVFLGPDGLPTSFRVEPGWNRKVSAEHVGGAVVEAFQAAMGERLAAWTTTLDDQGWQAQADQLRLDLDGSGPVSMPAGISPAFRSPADPMAARSIDHVAEEMIKAFDDVAGLTPPAPTGATGANRSGKLALTLSKAGLVSCIADVEWVSTQTSATLMNALGEALAAARTALESTPGQPGPSGNLDRLLADALALLSDPQRVLNS
jgi:hypothetical protein